MADSIEEVEDIVSLASGLNINIGTLNPSTVPAMLASGKKANMLSKPVILDPVGAGASSYRTNTARLLLSEIKFTAIRGNLSEIKTLVGESSSSGGVDASEEDIQSAI